MGRAVVVGAGDCADEAAAGPKINFDAPLGVALAEVETMTVDFAHPLFRTRAVVAVHDDPLLVREPRLKLGFLGLLGGFDLLAVRGLPERINVVEPLLERAAAFLGRTGADAVEPVVVQVAVGQPRVTRTPAMLAAVDVSPHGESIQRDISQLAGIGDIVAGEHLCQVVTVAPTRLAAGALDALPVVDRTWSSEKSITYNSGFLAHNGAGWHASLIAAHRRHCGPVRRNCQRPMFH